VQPGNQPVQPKKPQQGKQDRKCAHRPELLAENPPEPCGQPGNDLQLGAANVTMLRKRIRCAPIHLGPEDIHALTRKIARHHECLRLTPRQQAKRRLVDRDQAASQRKQQDREQYPAVTERAIAMRRQDCILLHDAACGSGLRGHPRAAPGPEPGPQRPIAANERVRATGEPARNQAGCRKACVR